MPTIIGSLGGISLYSWVFAAYHIGGCSGCALAEDETLKEVATAYGIPLEKLVRDLNSLVSQAE